MASDPLSTLRDLHLPPQIGNWPLAMGWYFLMALSLLLLLGALIHLWHKRHVRALRRQALAELHLTRQQDPIQLGCEINQLLKRILIARNLNACQVNLYGKAWCDVLDKAAPKLRYGHHFGMTLQACVYQAKPVPQPKVMLKATQQWIKALC